MKGGFVGSHEDREKKKEGKMWARKKKTKLGPAEGRG